VTIKNGDNPAISSSPNTVPTDAPASDKARRSAASSSSPAADTVSTDVHQAVFSKLLDPATAGNSSRVEELRSLYASGQYSVNPLEVSKSLIKSALLGD
jgi:anti-sigma28 factor (negative regulator of flagellin synthesis)